MSTRTLKDEISSAKLVDYDRDRVATGPGGASGVGGSGGRSVNTGMISQRCLGIVLKRTRVHNRQVGLHHSSSINSTALQMIDTTSSNDQSMEDWMFESGYLVFQDFQEENRHCFWNRTLVDSVNSIEYMGYVMPGTLLVGGNEYYLESIRSAWGRRVLKSPINFVISRLGDVTGLEMQVIPQTQFTPLPEALCLVISELNSEKETASLEIIFSRLQDRFSDMIVPNQEIVYVSLGKLIKDRKVYHTSDGYFIVTPETYHVTTVPTMPERPLLLTNEEAIHRLHGGQLLSSLRPSSAMRTRSVQTNMDDLSLCTRENSPSLERNFNSLSRLERSGSLRLSRKEKHKSKEEGESGPVVRSESMRLSPIKSKSLIKDINLKSSLAHQDYEKGEKISMFSKLFRRSSSKRRKSSKSPAKYATFSAQFPPIEWSDPNIVHYHSRSTQTLDGRRSSSSLTRLLLDNGMKRPLSSVAISSSAPTSNGTPSNLTTTSTPPNNKKNNTSLNNNHNDIDAVASPSLSPQQSMKSKTDSLTRLREHDKFNEHQHQLRTRSSTLDPMNLDQTGNSSSNNATNSTLMTSLSPLKTTTTVTSGLPVRKIQSHSCTVLQETPFNKRKTSTPSKMRGQSPASKSAPSKSATSSISMKPISGNSNSPSKIVNTERPSSYVVSHRSSDVEAKVKNTEIRNMDEDYKSSSRKQQNRWSVHGGNSEAPVGSVSGTSGATMNNTTSSPKKATASMNHRYSGMKCVNKLHGGSPSASPKHQVAVRPTQAIRPLTQTPDVDTKDSTDNETITPSPSFNKSFDIESSAFKSITAQKLLKGASINSIDTLVEVNMAAEKSNDEKSSGSIVGRRLSSASNGGASFKAKIINTGGGQSFPKPYCQEGNGKQAGAVQPRVVGEAHIVVTPVMATSAGTNDNNDCSVDDLKKTKPNNGSGTTAKVMAVV